MDLPTPRPVGRTSASVRMQLTTAAYVEATSRTYELVTRKLAVNFVAGVRGAQSGP